MNPYEASYYENDEVWRANFADNPEERARLQATVSVIPEDVGSLLDVGCGNGAFLHALESKVPLLHGVDRSKTALSYVRVPHTNASVDSLPFANDSFDVATCLEVIEHLPQDIYARALSELSRVARKWIVIGVPYREDTAADRVTCPECLCAFNRSYHLRSFDDEAMRGLWTQNGLPFMLDSLAHVGSVARYPGLNAVRRIVSPFRRPKLPSGAVCPQCGHYAPSPVGPSDAAKTGSKFRSLWLARARPRWYLARYRRNGS